MKGNHMNSSFYSRALVSVPAAKDNIHCITHKAGKKQSCDRLLKILYLKLYEFEENRIHLWFPNSKVKWMHNIYFNILINLQFV